MTTTTTTTTTKRLRFKWDEPKGCTTPRGWLHLERGHPDSDRYGFDWCGSRCVGNYLQYSPGGYSSVGPNGELVHAVAYLLRLTNIGTTTEPIGWKWFHTTAEARAWIEQQVRERLEKIANSPCTG